MRTPNSVASHKRVFVGRAAELAAIERAFEQEHRLVTLWGPGGIGKTALARRYASGTSADEARAAGGVWFCDLADARTAADVCASVARVLDVALSPGGRVERHIAQLENVIAARDRMLLVLDNFEQIVDVAATVVAPWIDASFELRVLVTSRERLRIDGEVCVEVPALVLPCEGDASVVDVEQSEAGALFLSHARLARSDFRYDERDAIQIAAVLRAIEGNPLAIELCASRMNVLSPSSLRAQLAEHALDGPGRARRDAPERQASLRGAIAWSWDLLDSVEQSALAQCSVFRGGFSLEAAAHVVSLPASNEAAPRSTEVLDALEALAEKSLLRVFDAPATPNERRFGLLESIRVFASEKLVESDGASAAHRRHAAYFLSVATRWARAADTLDGPRVVALLRDELDNVLAVAERALEDAPSRDEDALAAAVALAPLVSVGVMSADDSYIALFDRALEGVAEDPKRAGLAEALYARARTEIARSQLRSSLALFERCVVAARQSGDRAREALSLARVAAMKSMAGEPDVDPLLEVAASIATAVGDPWVQGMVAMDRVNVLRRSGADVGADALRAEAFFRRAGDRIREGAMLGERGAQLYDDGRLDEARRCCESALALVRSAGGRRRQADIMALLGYIAQARGALDEARVWHESALDLHRAQGDRWSEAWDLGNLGSVFFEARDYELALAHYEQATRMFEALGDQQLLVVLRSLQGAVEVVYGLVSIGRARLDECARSAPSNVSAFNRAVLALCRAQLDARLAREAEGRGDHARAIEHRADAQRVIDGVRRRDDGAGAALFDQSEDVRMCVRLLARELVVGATVEPSLGREACVLRLGPEGRWVTVGDGARIELLKHRALRLMLLALVEQRAVQPGKALTLADLFAAGWPGERAREESISNRVYVSLTRLRKLGLRPVLQSRDDGFLLDPESVIEREGWPAPPA